MGSSDRNIQYPVKHSPRGGLGSKSKHGKELKTNQPLSNNFYTMGASDPSESSQDPRSRQGSQVIDLEEVKFEESPCKFNTNQKDFVIMQAEGPKTKKAQKQFMKDLKKAEDDYIAKQLADYQRIEQQE